MLESPSHVVFWPPWREEYKACDRRKLEEVWRLPNETLKAILYEKPK